VKWPWRHDDPEGHERADAALALSREQRELAVRKAAEDRERAALWRRWQLENHFAEAFRAAMRGEGHT
jgi:hypothetical protein